MKLTQGNTLRKLNPRYATDHNTLDFTQSVYISSFIKDNGSSHRADKGVLSEQELVCLPIYSLSSE